MAFQTIIQDRQGGVGIIILNRPEKLNALTAGLTLELDQCITQFEADDSVKAIVITAAGDRAFSSGFDIHEMSHESDADFNERFALNVEQYWHLAVCHKPTIGAVNGLAYGAGALLSSILDIRIGCERTSFRFLGAAYGRINSTWTLPLIVGLPIAKELLFTGRTVDAEEALRVGLLNKLVPSAELLKTAIDMGQSIAANNAKAVQEIKGILSRDVGMSLREMLLNEAQTITQNMPVLPPTERFKGFLDRKPNAPQ
ncbi:MAG: enoyl-CoA hydratase/isomerase family protein [Chloroflexota bacterium]